MVDRLGNALRVLPDYLAQHILLSITALLLGVLLGLPLSLIAARKPRWRGPVMTAASLVQTIPGLALLALFYPVLLALSRLTNSLFGVTFSALGFLPSLLALALYSVLPILRNGVAGLTGIDPDVLDAADGVGMTEAERLTRVEIPLAAPVVMAGIRTSSVWTIGAATLSTSVGQTSLGNFIFSGLQTENWVDVLVGCVSASILALAVDRLLATIETAVSMRRWRSAWMGLAVIACGTLVALVPSLRIGAAPIVVGAKNFSEQFILAEVVASRLEARGMPVARKLNLGSAIAFRALASSEIDVYIDYSGTLWTNVMARRDVPPRETMLREIAAWMRARYGITMLGALGFENAYALAMRSDRASALGVRSISDLAPHAQSLNLGADLEFLSRPEWATLRDAYHLHFREQRSFSPTFMYRAIEDGSADVISAFSSDGRIAALHLAVLDDDKNVTPTYDAVILISPKRSADARVRQALQPLVGAITVDNMRAANLTVDRDRDKATPAEAARALLAASSLDRKQ